MTWYDLLLAHWPVRPRSLETLIPKPLELDTYNGEAWLSIVPFGMCDVAPRFVPAIPGVSAFLELNVPLLKSLTLSAAARYDDYSDVGDTTNPKFGLTWDVTDQFSLQGTWGTSFRAPSVTDSNPKAVTSGTSLPFPNYDPRITNGLLPAGFIGPFGLANSALLLGSNPDLVPEEAETWSVSANFRHEGFEVGLTYWDITYDDQIIFPGSISAYAAGPSGPPGYNGWGSLVIPVNNPATCDNSDISTADPVLQPFLESLNYDFVSAGGSFGSVSSLRNDFCKVNVIVGKSNHGAITWLLVERRRGLLPHCVGHRYKPAVLERIGEHVSGFELVDPAVQRELVALQAGSHRRMSLQVL